MFFAPVVRTRTINPIYRTLDRNFERFVNEAFYGAGLPATSVEQDEQGWTLTLDVPGLTREELSIGIEGAVVRIESKADAKRQYKAAYELSQDIDTSASEAKLEHGVLTLRLAKKAPVSNVTALAIN